MTVRTALLVLAVLPAAALAAGCGNHTAVSKPVSQPVSQHVTATSTPTLSTSAPATSGGPASRLPPSTTATTSTPAPVTSTGPCRTSQLAFSLGAHATSGDRTTYALAMRNTAAAPCSVSGYPAVDLLETGGMQAGPAAADLPGDAPNGTPSTVLLPSGTSATANLSYVAAADGGADCDPVPVADLLVFAPGQRTSATVPFAASACTDAADRPGITPAAATT
jgi:hypothetical protein